MGYVTWFSITLIKGDKKEYEEFLNDLAKESGYDCIGKEPSGFEAKWPSYENDLRVVTKRHPSLIVEVGGDGEESDDLWTERWRNGENEHVNHIDPTNWFFRLAGNEERRDSIARMTGHARRTLCDCIATLVRELPSSQVKVDLPQYTEVELQLHPFDDLIVLVMEEDDTDGHGRVSCNLFLKWDKKRTPLEDESIDALEDITGTLLHMVPEDYGRERADEAVSALSAR